MNFFAKLFSKIHDYRTGPYTVDLDNQGPLPDGETADDALKQAKKQVQGNTQPAKIKKILGP